METFPPPFRVLVLVPAGGRPRPAVSRGIVRVDVEGTERAPCVELHFGWIHECTVMIADVGDVAHDVVGLERHGVLDGMGSRVLVVEQGSRVLHR